MKTNDVRRALTLYFSSEILLSIGIGMVLYAQPFFYKSCGLSDKGIGVLFAANSITSGVVALLGGTIIGRIGPSRVFKFATLVIPIGYLLMVNSRTFYMLILAAIINGIGGAMLMSTENVVLNALTKGKNLANVLSKFVAMYTFVMGSGAVLSGVLSSHIGYTSTILWGAGIALLAPVIRYFVQAEDALADKLFRLPSPKILAMSVFSLVFGLGVGILNPFVTLILKDTFAFSTQTTAVVSACSTFMMSLGAFLVGGMIRRFTSERTLLLSFLFSIGVTIVMAFTGAGWSFAGLYLLRTMVTSVPGSIVDATFLEMSNPSEYSQMFGVRVFGTGVGNATGSFVGGTLLGHQALQELLVCSSIVFVVAYLYLQYLLRRLRRYRGATLQDENQTLRME